MIAKGLTQLIHILSIWEFHFRLLWSIIPKKRTQKFDFITVFLIHIEPRLSRSLLLLLNIQYWDLSGAKDSPTESNHSAAISHAFIRSPRTVARWSLEEYKQTSSAYCRILIFGTRWIILSKSATYIEYNMGLRTQPWGKPLCICLTKFGSLCLKCTSLKEIRLKTNLINNGRSFNLINFWINMSHNTLS